MCRRTTTSSSADHERRRGCWIIVFGAVEAWDSLWFTWSLFRVLGSNDITVQKWVNSWSRTSVTFLFVWSSGKVFGPERLLFNRSDSSHSCQRILHSNRLVGPAFTLKHRREIKNPEQSITSDAIFVYFCPFRWSSGPKRRISRLLHQHLSASEPHPRGHLSAWICCLFGSW